MAKSKLKQEDYHRMFGREFGESVDTAVKLTETVGVNTGFLAAAVHAAEKIGSLSSMMWKLDEQIADGGKAALENGLENIPGLWSLESIARALSDIAAAMGSHYGSDAEEDAHDDDFGDGEQGQDESSEASEDQ